MAFTTKGVSLIPGRGTDSASHETWLKTLKIFLIKKNQDYLWPVVPLLGICLMGILQHMQNVCLYKNIASLFVVAKGWKQWKCLLIADWLQLSPQYIINKTTKVQNYPTTLEE